jgi:hypothetical protein
MFIAIEAGTGIPLDDNAIIRVGDPSLKNQTRRLIPGICGNEPRSEKEEQQQQKSESPARRYYAMGFWSRQEVIWVLCKQLLKGPLKSPVAIDMPIKIQTETT